MRATKVQASLRIRAVSPEPSLLAHTSSESRGTFRQKARSLVLLNGWACAVEICHDGILEDTNSLDGARIFFKILFKQCQRFNALFWREVITPAIPHTAGMMEILLPCTLAPLFPTLPRMWGSSYKWLVHINWDSAYNREPLGDGSSRFLKHSAKMRFDIEKNRGHVKNRILLIIDNPLMKKYNVFIVTIVTAIVPKSFFIDFLVTFDLYDSGTVGHPLHLINQRFNDSIQLFCQLPFESVAKQQDFCDMSRSPKRRENERK